MKRQRHSTDSHRRWRIAQLAEYREKQAFIRELNKSGKVLHAHLPAAFGIDADSTIFRDNNTLEIGCSPFAFIHEVREAKSRVGIDPLSHSWRESYRPGSAAMIQSCGEYLPLKNDSFRCVIHINTLDHTREPSLVLREVHRVLAMDGILILSIQVWASPYAIRQRLLGKVDTAHPHHLSKQEVFSMLKNTGFHIDRYDVRGIPRPKTACFSKQTLKWFLLRLIVWEQCNIVARKKVAELGE